MQIVLVAKNFVLVQIFLECNVTANSLNLGGWFENEPFSCVKNWKVFSSQVHSYIFNVLLQNKIDNWQAMALDQLSIEVINLYQSEQFRSMFNQDIRWGLVKMILEYAVRYSILTDHLFIKLLFVSCRGIMLFYGNLSFYLNQTVRIAEADDLFRHPDF